MCSVLLTFFFWTFLALTVSPPFHKTSGYIGMWMAQFEDHSEFGHSLLHDRQARSFGQICGRFTPKVPSGPRPLRIHKRGDDGESYLVNQCHVKREGG